VKIVIDKKFLQEVNYLIGGVPAEEASERIEKGRKWVKEYAEAGELEKAERLYVVISKLEDLYNYLKEKGLILFK